MPGELHDDRPARRWEDAFGTGDGRHGALVLGEPHDETVVVTRHGLVLPNGTAGCAAPDLTAVLDRVRDLALAGRDADALALVTDDRPAVPLQPFHPAFALRLRTDPTAGAAPVTGATGSGSSYRRTLDLSTGVLTVSWSNGLRQGHREVFVSRADAVVVVRVSGAGPAGLDVRHDVRFPGSPDALVVEPFETGTGSGVVVRYPDDGQGAAGYVGVTRRADTAGETVLLTRVERVGRAQSFDAVRAALVAGLDLLDPDGAGLLARHVATHRPTAERVTLDLRAVPALQALPTSALLARCRRAGADVADRVALLERLFAAGRHHLLASSGERPPRLVGLWHGDWTPPWSAAYTIDANLPLQLAGAVVADVPEAVAGLARLLDDQWEDWRHNAARVFGARGVLAPAHTDGDHGRSIHFDATWPLHLWPAGAAWLLVPLVDLARSRPGEPLPDGLDRDRLGTLLVDVARFWADVLVRRDAAGRVVVVPSYSPENAPLGRTPLAVNATMDLAAARQVLELVTGAGADVAEVRARPEEVDRWRALLDLLPAYRVTEVGALAEWAWPGLADDEDHRHVSHLYPAWPLAEITPDGTPALAAAALTALHRRGDENGSAHGYLHIALAAARLHDAGLVGRVLERLLGGDFWFDGLMSSHYPGLDVFNADAACALPGLVVEALVSGRPGHVDLLPAAPSWLSAGTLRGARTTAGVRVEELRWDLAGRTASAVLVSAVPRTVTVTCLGARADVALAPGAPVRVDAESGALTVSSTTVRGAGAQDAGARDARDREASAGQDGAGAEVRSW